MTLALLVVQGEEEDLACLVEGQLVVVDELTKVFFNNLYSSLQFKHFVRRLTKLKTIYIIIKLHILSKTSLIYLILTHVVRSDVIFN